MRAGFRAQARNRGDWAAWQERYGRHDWTGWSWSDWASGASESSKPGKPGRGDEGPAERGTTRARPTGPGGRSRRGGPNPFSDLERIAIQFATELRAAAKQTGNIGERSLNDLRDILTDTLAKVRTEVFGDTGSAAGPATTSMTCAQSPGRLMHHPDSHDERHHPDRPTRHPAPPRPRLARRVARRPARRRMPTVTQGPVQGRHSRI